MHCSFPNPNLYILKKAGHHRPPRNMKQNSTDTHPADIKAALAKRGLTLADLSRAAVYCDRAAGVALGKPWPAVERIIAAALARRPQDIWPSRYDATGKSLCERRGWKDNTADPRRNVQSTRAA